MSARQAGPNSAELCAGTRFARLDKRNVRALVGEEMVHLGFLDAATVNIGTHFVISNLQRRSVIVLRRFFVNRGQFFMSEKGSILNARFHFHSLTQATSRIGGIALPTTCNMKSNYAQPQALSAGDLNEAGADC